MVAAADWLRLAEDVAPEVEWDCVEDAFGNLVLIGSGTGPSGVVVHLAMPIGQPRSAPVAETAGAIRALAEDVKARRAA